MGKVRSPLFYVGDKYKLMPQLTTLMPDNIDTFYDIFAGGGSASMAVNAKKYKLNDIDINVIHLHEHLMNELTDVDAFLKKMHRLIKHYDLTCSAIGDVPNNIDEIKQRYKKTYYAKINKEGYLKLRDDYNLNPQNYNLLYLLLVFGFNHMTRFNNSGKFNLPVGNVDWNHNVENALKNYANFSNKRDIKLYNEDFEDFIGSQNLNSNDFVYVDPPYLITFSEYNKMWNEDTEKRLYTLLDTLDRNNIHWGLSNVLTYKGRRNKILLNWLNEREYKVYPIKSNYISRFDNTIKEDTKEVFVIN